MPEDTFIREAQRFYKDQGAISFDLESVSLEQRQRFADLLESIFEDISWEVIEYRSAAESPTENWNRRDVLRQRRVGIGNEDWGGRNTFLYIEEREITRKARKSLFRPFEQEPWPGKSYYHMQFGIGRAEQITGGQPAVDVFYAAGETEVTINGDKAILEGLGFSDKTDSVDVVCGVFDFLQAKMHGQSETTDNDYLNSLV
ncbi:MAG TPA: hypothetical protein VMQ52_00290 [Candidatus Saccharimonadales bacterium]|jgi:hypothetical protein|nr:hypothetical protein [Candidatus Saccharimonadales bacterium]